METDEYFPSGDAASGMEAEDEDIGTEEILETCLTRFASPDFIMEPEIFTQLKCYFQAQNSPYIFCQKYQIDDRHALIKFSPDQCKSNSLSGEK